MSELSTNITHPHSRHKMNNNTNGTNLKVRYSQIDPEALTEELITRYNWNDSVRCDFYNSGMNDIYIVKSAGMVYYLRISFTGLHDRIAYEEEVYIINTLSENQISVASPVCCKDGTYVWDIMTPEGKRYAILFHEAKNQSSNDAVKQAFRLGAMLAKMHSVADKENFVITREPIDLEKLAFRSLEKIKPHLSHRQDDLTSIEKVVKDLCDYIKRNFNYEKPYYGFCHGDIHNDNVFFDGDNPTMFDFDCMGYGWRAYDICTYAWNKTYTNEKYIETKEWQAYLDGYNSIRQLSEIEVESIHAFAVLRELWVMGHHADLITRNIGCSWYNDSYFNSHVDIILLWYHRAFPVK